MVILFSYFFLVIKKASLEIAALLLSHFLEYTVRSVKLMTHKTKN